MAMALLCGCASSPPVAGDGAVIPIPTGTERTMAGFQASSLMYLQSQPYSSIYVEVDAVEGAEVPEKEFQEVAQFLERYCRKPVTVKLKKVIPAAAASGLSPTAVATQNMEGPPEGAAYMYFLLFPMNSSRQLKQ